MSTWKSSLYPKRITNIHTQKTQNAKTTKMRKEIKKERKKERRRRRRRRNGDASSSQPRPPQAVWPRPRNLSSVTQADPGSMTSHDLGLSLFDLMGSFSLWSDGFWVFFFFFFLIWTLGPQILSLWSDGFFLSLIWWFFFFFFNLDFRWLSRVDLVGCFVLADVFCTPTLAEISRTNWVFECQYINRVSKTQFPGGLNL